MTVEMDISPTTQSGSSLGHPRAHLSPHYPALLCALWAQFPLPEWIPTAGPDTWQKTIRAMTQLWREAGSYGVVMSGPIPWLPEQEWSHHPETNPWQLQTHPQTPPSQTVDLDPDTDPASPEIFRWLFTADPQAGAQPTEPETQLTIPILPEDPLVEEQFLILITPVFNAVVAQGLHPHTGQQGLMISFEPEAIQRAGQVLLARTQHTCPGALPLWQAALQSFPLLPPHHRVVARFSSLLLMSDSTLLELASTAQLPTTSPSTESSPQEDPVHLSPLALPSDTSLSLPPPGSLQTTFDEPLDEESSISEAELLQALAHDIRTPLTTILTNARLALRQKSLTKAQTFLKRIEQECKEQIEKFDLIYQAVEPKPKHLQLGPIALTELIQQNLPKWRSQVERQGSTLEMEISEDLTDVMSDSQTLDTILSGMIRQLARNSPPSSQISARLTNAGELVKLQFQVTATDTPPSMKPRQAIGQLLMLQPETGAISLSLPVTRTLFRALGGYLTFKQKAKQGETLTIYLPRRI